MAGAVCTVARERQGQGARELQGVPESSCFLFRQVGATSCTLMNGSCALCR